MDSTQDRPLAGRVAVVTGAASGMGRAMACALAADGAQVVAIDVQEDVAAILCADATFAGLAPVGIKADLAQAADCERAAGTALDVAKACHILVNCAGISMGPLTPRDIRGLPTFWQAEPRGIAMLMAINAVAPQLMARHLAPAMIDAGWGRIVNVTTSFDTMINRGMNAYGASKAALEAASASWSKELGGTGVTVNVLVPGGMTATPFLPPHMRQGALDPNVMRAPIRWLASRSSDGISGLRFVAKLWTPGNPLAGSAPVAWPELAATAVQNKN